MGGGRMSKETTRTILLETGKQLFLARGYSSTGIEAVVQAAGVPKGSFYYYFGSKEEFGLQVLDRFAEEVRANFEHCLGDTSVPPIQRFRHISRRSANGSSRRSVVLVAWWAT